MDEGTRDRKSKGRVDQINRPKTRRQISRSNDSEGVGLKNFQNKLLNEKEIFTVNNHSAAQNEFQASGALIQAQKERIIADIYSTATRVGVNEVPVGLRINANNGVHAQSSFNDLGAVNHYNSRAIYPEVIDNVNFQNGYMCSGGYAEPHNYSFDRSPYDQWRRNADYLRELSHYHNRTFPVLSTQYHQLQSSQVYSNSLQYSNNHVSTTACSFSGNFQQNLYIKQASISNLGANKTNKGAESVATKIRDPVLGGHVTGIIPPTFDSDLSYVNKEYTTEITAGSTKDDSKQRKAYSTENENWNGLSTLNIGDLEPSAVESSILDLSDFSNIQNFSSHQCSVFENALTNRNTQEIDTTLERSETSKIDPFLAAKSTRRRQKQWDDSTMVQSSEVYPYTNERLQHPHAAQELEGSVLKKSSLCGEDECMTASDSSNSTFLSSVDQYRTSLSVQENEMELKTSSSCYSTSKVIDFELDTTDTYINTFLGIFSEGSELLIGSEIIDYDEMDAFLGKIVEI